MWQVHFARNAVTAALPFQRPLRRLKRRLAGKAHRIHEASVYSGGFDQIRFLREAGFDLAGSDLLEVGTGWYPVIPLMLRLAGARHVTLTDMHRLMDGETLDAALAFLEERADDLAEKLGLSREQVRAYLASAPTGPLDERLAALGLSYHTPFDYFGPARIDAIFSHTVLEHIPPAAITELMRNARALLRPGGLISHGIDHSDHRAHRDTALSRIDFLRYSDRAWRWLCLNPQDYTNRLRHSDYVALIEGAGFEILWQRPLIDSGALNDLEQLPLDKRFAGRAPEDLATLWSNIIARPTVL